MPGGKEFSPWRLNASEAVQVIHQDARGTLWVGAQSGLLRLRGDTLISAGIRGFPQASVRALRIGNSIGVGRVSGDTYGAIADPARAGGRAAACPPPAAASLGRPDGPRVEGGLRAAAWAAVASRVRRCARIWSITEAW